MRPLFAAASAAVLVATFAATAGAEEVKPADKPAEAPAPASPTGALFDLGAGAMYTGGQIAKDAKLGALEVVFAFRGGYYFTQHVGLVGGVELGFGNLTTGCEDAHGKESDKCGAFSAKLPVVVQYAFENKHRGVYVEGGVSALHVHGLTATDQLAMFFSPADLSLGLGMRVPYAVDPKAKAGTLELRFRGEAGMFTMGSFRDGDASVSGDVTEKSLHYGLTLSLARQF